LRQREPTMRVGLLGAGHIADQYVAGMAQFANLELVAVADRDGALATRRARQWGLRALSPASLLTDHGVELVVNLTPPRAHFETTSDALRAGKHVYLEKPLAIEVEDGRRLVELARDQGLGLGCAPDTFLGSALPSARDALRAGLIGDPISAVAFVGNSGPELWHPSPAAYYDRGAGPLFSLGPYYLTWLTQLLGPIAEVAAFSSTPRATRSRPDGSSLPVSTATTYAGALRFVNGGIATLFASYDVQAERLVPIELYGSRGTLSIPDPNHFDGPVLLSDDHGGWRELPARYPIGRGRGAGVADLVDALRIGAEPGASAGLALHVLDAICALDEGGRALTTTI
jgi:predicted dehydrogenase